MSRCRRTDTIADIVADPALGSGAMTTEQRAHVAICADCHAAVAALDEVDGALASDLRAMRVEDLPPSVLATPAIERSERAGGWLAGLAAAGVVVVVVAVAAGGYGWLRDAGIRLAPDPTSSATGAATPARSPDETSLSTPSVTPSPLPSAELAVGQIAAVVDEPLVVRAEPSTADPSTITEERLWIGQRVRILAGPVEESGYRWWEVQVGDIRGWIADAERDESAPWISPVGNGRIAFSRMVGETAVPDGLFTVNSDGNDERDLARPTAGEIQLVASCAAGIGPAEWTHDGAWAVFGFALDDCGSAVAVVRADGSDQRTIGPGWIPTWSPDGASVTYGENLDLDGDGPSRLMTADRDGGEPSPLFTGEPFTFASQPAWSPDRRSIAFSMGTLPAGDDGRGEPSAVFIADADGTNPRRLATGHSPVWSPDGRWIVFEVQARQTSVDIHRIRPDGTGQTVLAEGESPVFSPDGSRLAYVSAWGVTTVAPDGTDPSGVVPATVVSGLAWSPDGSQLVVSAEYAGSSGLYRVALGGAAPAIIGLGVEGSSPTWQPLLLDPHLAD